MTRVYRCSNGQTENIFRATCQISFLQDFLDGYLDASGNIGGGDMFMSGYYTSSFRVIRLRYVNEDAVSVRPCAGE